MSGAETCPTCHGLGETVAASRRIGGGCVNDDWDACPACGGLGETSAASRSAGRAKSYRTLSLDLLEFSALEAFLIGQLVPAHRRLLEQPGHAASSAYQGVRKAAVAALGEARVTGLEAASRRAWRARQPQAARITDLELEALR